MTDTELPTDIKAFVFGHLPSVERLEILLLLVDKPDWYWGATAVASALNISPTSAERELEKLCASNLLEIRIAAEILYRFSPASDQLGELVERLVEMYRRDRTAITRAVVAARTSAARDFADAFRVKKGKQDA